MGTENGQRPNLRLLMCGAAGYCSLCFAFAFLSIFLLLTILLCVLHVPLGIEKLTIAGSSAIFFERVVVPVSTVLGEMLKSLSPWGLIAFAAIAVVLWGPPWIREALSLGKWELPGGIKYDGSGPASFRRELTQAEWVVNRANRELAEAYASAHSFASQLRNQYDISPLASSLAIEVARLIGDRCPTDFRLTLYVPDFIFSDRLYQFTEYYDHSGAALAKGRVGRTFSVRYGIIGRVWRSGVPEIEGELISPSEIEQLPPNYSQSELERFIARRWGLSLSEAIHVKKYNSYGAIRLQRADKPVGLLYFDSASKNAFCEAGQSKQLETRLTQMLEEAPILMKLLEISNEVAPWSGRIQIIRNSGTAVV